MSKSLVAIALAAALLLVGAVGDIAQSAKTLRNGPVIGIKVVPVSADVATLVDLERARGLMVVLVVPNSPAAQAGIARDDVIISANGRPTNSKNDLVSALRSAAASHRLVLQVWRGGATSDVKIPFQAPGDKGLAVDRSPVGAATEFSRK